MSKPKGKREAADSGWNKGGDPFAGNRPAGDRSVDTARWARIALIALGAVVGVALLVVGAWQLLVTPPDVSDNVKKPRPDQTQTGGEDPAGEDTPPFEGDAAQVDGDGRKEEFYTFLLLGKDTSSGSTDTIILVSYDVKAGAVSCMSIPRDTMVNVSWDIKRINSVYSSRQGIEGLKARVAELTGVLPDFHVIIEWKAVGELVDELGGVYFDVPYHMDYDDPYQDLHIHQEKGYRLLDGDDAMQVIRWRQNNSGKNYGDTVRVQIQQDFLKAVAKQCLQLGNWTKVKGFAEIFAENVETDVHLNNLLWFAQKAMSVDMEKVRFMTLPGNYEGWAYSRSTGGNQSYVFAYPEEVAEMVNQYFNPYTEEITTDDLQIMYKNRNGSLGVTNGTLADPRAAQAPPARPAASDPEEEDEEPALPPEGEGETSPGEDTQPGNDSGLQVEPAPGTEGEGESNPGEGSDSGLAPGGGTGEDPGAESDPGAQPAPDGGGEPALPPEEPAPPEEPEDPLEEDFNEEPPGWLGIGD